MLPLFDSPPAGPPGRPGDGGAWFAAAVYAAAAERREDGGPAPAEDTASRRA